MTDPLHEVSYKIPTHQVNDNIHQKVQFQLMQYLEDLIFVYFSSITGIEPKTQEEADNRSADLGWWFSSSNCDNVVFMVDFEI